MKRFLTLTPLFDLEQFKNNLINNEDRELLFAVLLENNEGNVFNGKIVLNVLLVSKIQEDEFLVFGKEKEFGMWMSVTLNVCGDDIFIMKPVLLFDREFESKSEEMMYVLSNNYSNIKNLFKDYLSSSINPFLRNQMLENDRKNCFDIKNGFDLDVITHYFVFWEDKEIEFEVRSQQTEVFRKYWEETEERKELKENNRKIMLLVESIYYIEDEIVIIGTTVDGKNDVFVKYNINTKQGLLKVDVKFDVGDFVSNHEYFYELEERYDFGNWNIFPDEDEFRYMDDPSDDIDEMDYDYCYEDYLRKYFDRTCEDVEADRARAEERGDYQEWDKNPGFY